MPSVSYGDFLRPSPDPNEKWRRKNRKEDVGLLSRADGVSGTDARDEEDASSRLLVGCHRPFKKKDLSGVEKRAGGGHREREPPRLPLAGAGAAAAFQDPAHEIVRRPSGGI